MKAKIYRLRKLVTHVGRLRRRLLVSIASFFSRAIVSRYASDSGYKEECEFHRAYYPYSGP